MTRGLRSACCLALLVTATCDAGTDAYLRALELHRPYELLLAGQNTDLPCEQPEHPTQLRALAPLACAAPPAPLRAELLDAAARLRADASSAPDSSARLGRLDLITAGTTSEILDRAVLRLERAAAHDDPAALNDLAVAYAARASARAEPADLFRALETVLAALEGDSSLAAARYNRAVLFDRISVPAEAARAWSAIGRRSPAAPPADGDRQSLREDTVARALQRWAAAELASDTGASRRELDVLRAGAARLAALDSTALHTVQLLGASRDGARRDLARGHAALARADAAFRAGNFAGAARDYAAAARLLGTHADPYAHWAELGLAAGALYDARYDDAERIALDIAGTSAPALRGRALWIHGLGLGRRGRYEAAIVAYRTASRSFERAGESENYAALQFLLSESLSFLGQHREGQRTLLAASEQLAAHPASPRRHDFLLNAGRYFTRLGLLRVARVYHAEGLHVAARTGRAKDPGEVLVRLAQAELLAGDSAAAARTIAAAERAYQQVRDPLMRERGRADLLDTRSELALRARPADAVALLTAALAYYEGQRNHPGSVRMLTRRGYARQAAGDRAGATADLARAIALVEHDLDAARGPTERGALRESALHAYDAMVALHLASGEPRRALGMFLRSRGLAREPEPALPAVAAGTTLLVLATLPDSLVSWRISADTIRVTARAAARPDMARRAAEFARAVRRDEPEARALGTALFRDLIGALPPSDSSRLLIVADGPLAQLPFAALVEPRTGRYLVERTRLQMVGTLQPDRWQSITPRARVLVADGSGFDRDAFPDLAPLPGAEREAAAVANTYAAPTLLHAAALTPRTLLAALPAYQVLHFAGHARALPDAPDRSYLVTAPDANGSGTITAAEIAALDLHRLQLVVLSACSSADAGTSRATEGRGLAHAFLAAGADAVVASVFEVEDRATGELLTRFHRHVAEGDVPAAALRRAQRSLAAAGRPPADWAAFQYFGALD